MKKKLFIIGLLVLSLILCSYAITYNFKARFCANCGHEYGPKECQVFNDSLYMFTCFICGTEAEYNVKKTTASE